MGILDRIAGAFTAVVPRSDHDASEHGGAHDDAPIAVDAKGWCHGDRLTILESPRTNRLHVRKPVGMTAHWTATGLGTAWTIAKAWSKMPSPGQHVGSAHFIIGRSGFIIQMVSCLRGSWHAGYGHRFHKVGNRWEVDPKRASKTNANHLFIGVEIECVGEVRPTGGRFMGWPFGKDGRRGPVVPADQVIEGVDHDGRRRLYHAYSMEQVVAYRRLLRALAAEYGIDRWGASWGHVDIDPDRKSDPGPAWGCHAMPDRGHLPAILNAVYGAET